MRLRHAIKDSLPPLITAYRQSFESLKQLAVKVDLEKYCDIYEISHSDLQEGKIGEIIPNIPNDESDDDYNTLKALKQGLRALHVSRKLCLCSLLALNADGGRSDFSIWSTAVESMRSLASMTAEIATNVEKILSEEEGRLYLKAWPLKSKYSSSLPHTSNAPGPSDARKGAYEKSNEKIGFAFSRHPGPPG